ncbi:MAG: DMT family transporter [Parafilimonas terrae]|nr:DMT family transporter [Parafilimonas terrae]
MSSSPFKAPSASAAIALFLFGIFLFAVNDALGKWLVTGYSVGQVLLLRTVGAALILAPVLLNGRNDLRLRDQRFWHGLRIACMAVDSFCFYFATKSLPLADVMTFYLAAPIMVTALSGPVLGERVGAFRWAAVLVGFCGVVIALQPSGAAFSTGALVALAGSATFASAMTVTRRLRDTHWAVLIAWQFAGAGLVGAVASLLDWTAPQPFDVVLMFVVGILSMVCFICITKALAIAPASLLAPFQYTSIVWAVILGWIVFGDRPTPHIILGSAVIIASGLAVFGRERWHARTTAMT